MDKVLEGILYAVGGIEDQDMLAKICKKADRKLRALGHPGIIGAEATPTVNLAEINSGDELMIGTSHGQKTRVRVLTVNKKRVKVELLEDRGTKKLHPAGSTHDFYPDMIRSVHPATAPDPVSATTSN